MGRRRPCTCTVTGNPGDTDDFYRIRYGSQNYYFETKELGDNWLAEKEAKKAERERKRIEREAVKKDNAFLAQIKDYIYLDMLNYQNDQPFPTMGTKLIKELHEFYTYETIWHTLELSKPAIEFAMKYKNFNNDFQAITYIMAIIRNKIKEVWEAEERLKRQNEAFDETVDTSNEIPDATDEYAEDFELKNPKQEVKDISQFFDFD